MSKGLSAVIPLSLWLAPILYLSVRPGDLDAVTEPYESEEPNTTVGLNLNFFFNPKFYFLFMHRLGLNK